MLLDRKEVGILLWSTCFVSLLGGCSGALASFVSSRKVAEAGRVRVVKCGVVESNLHQRPGYDRDREKCRPIQTIPLVWPGLELG